MPLYEYECENDQDHNFEVRQGFHEDALTTCPTCEGPVHRVIHPSSIHYKGGGFYSTDYKPDTRVKGESGQLGHKVSETDRSTIDNDIPTKTDSKGRPKTTPTRPKPINMHS